MCITYSLSVMKTCKNCTRWTPFAIAYPHTARYGADQAMDRDDVIDQDWGAINSKVGIYSRASYSSTHDCTPLGATHTVERGTSCDFLRIEMRLSHYRTVG